MFNIAVLVYDLINDYNYTVVEGIASYFNDKDDVRLIISSVHIPHPQNGSYDFQHWTSVKLLESMQIDGIIVVPNSFMGYLKIEELARELKNFEGRPIVSVSSPLNIKGNKYTHNSCELAYQQIVEHLKEKHDCRKFAFFGGELVNSDESKERFEAYKKALLNYNLAFNENLVFQGDFTPGKAKQILSEKYKTKEDVDFDALICANDYTAGGSMLHLIDLGLKIPDDVKVVGFDDSDFALLTYPTLTSISQTVPQTGAKAAEMIYKTIKGQCNEDKNIINCFPIYRQSCGCVDSKTHCTSFYNQNGDFVELDQKKQAKDLDVIQKYQQTLYSIYKFLNVLDSQIPIEKIVDNLKKSMVIANFSAFMICLYDEPITLFDTKDFTPPEKIRVQIAVDVEKNVSAVYPFNKGPEFSLKSRLAPVEYEHHLDGKYFLHPIFLHNKNYGYMFCKATSDDYMLSSINLRMFSDLIVHSYEYSVEQIQKEKLIESTMSLALKAKTDELTQLFNRRGIFDYGQQTIDLSISMNRSGIVFFCDMDGLKKINDTYGHKTGDLAIQTMAKILKLSFRETDLIGRLSGDEFCIVAPGFAERKVEEIRRKLLENGKKLSEEANLPLTVTCSLGAVHFSPKLNNLNLLLQQADKKLYEEKKIKHAKNN